MTNDQLALILLAAFWTGTSAVFTAFKYTGDIRDKLVSGKLDHEDLPLGHAWRLFLVDWFPIKASISMLSAVLAAVILLIPKLAEKPTQQMRDVCYIAAAIPAVGSVVQVVAWLVESWFLYSLLRQRSNPKQPVEIRAAPPQSNVAQAPTPPA
jgi:hypothetical protein